MAAGAVSLKNLTKCEEVRILGKGADQAKCLYGKVQGHKCHFFIIEKLTLN